ncbi:MAG: type II secretion system secretin GspD [Gammaproteobacteria bacterium]|nr:type II secretion system secretin GspD [Gammaproteobacteria bacterium]
MFPHKHRTSFFKVVSAAILLTASFTAQAEPVTLNLKAADLSAVISTISEITGKNFIVDPRVKGKVTIVSSHPMKEKEVYEVFLTVLEVHGYAAVPSGNKGTIKIIPVANAKQSAVPMASSNRPGKGDEIVTRVLQLENISASQMVPILRPLLPQQSHLAAYSPANVLIISDRAANIKRIVKIINRIDLPDNNEVEIIPLQHASANEIVRILTTLQQQDNKKGSKSSSTLPTLIADERTNSILIGGGKAGRIKLRGIIGHLDTPLETEGNTRVIYLHYAKAKDLVPVLTGVGTSLEQEKQGKKGKASSNSQSPMSIQADEFSNSLVITAPPDLFNSLQRVIKQLDIRRAQVYIETIIAEVSSNRAAELGVQWAAGGDLSKPAAVTNFTAGDSIINLGGAIEAGTLPSIGSGLTLGVGKFVDGALSFGALIRALKGDGSTNILSTPTLITMDNEEAEIVVGQNVPFKTGSYTSTGGSSATPGNPFQTIKRENIGITLKVTPQINEGDAVQLKVEQKVESISPAVDGAVDLITNTRSINTNVIVDDGDIIVFGGLITDDLNETTQKVPLLGDIPLLGRLFSYNKTTKRKTNMMMFLRPVILRDSASTNSISQGKYSYMRAEQLKVQEKGLSMLPNSENPVMPDAQDFFELPPPFMTDDAIQDIKLKINK